MLQRSVSSISSSGRIGLGSVKDPAGPIDRVETYVFPLFVPIVDFPFGVFYSRLSASIILPLMSNCSS